MSDADVTGLNVSWSRSVGMACKRGGGPRRGGPRGGEVMWTDHALAICSN